MEVTGVGTQLQNVSVMQTQISLPEIFHALTLSSDSLNHFNVAAGERIIHDYKNHDRFLEALATVLSDNSVPESPRILAAILFRNSTERFWRNGPSMLAAKDKEALRLTIFRACFQTESLKILKQLVATIGKIARYDFPRHWPTVIEEIGRKLSEENLETQSRAIRLLHECTRELATKRLPIDRKSFCEVTGNIFLPVLTILQANLAHLMAGVNSGYPQYDVTVQISRYAAKVLQTLMVNGIRDHKASALFKEYWKYVCDGNVILNLLALAASMERKGNLPPAATEDQITYIKKIARTFLRTVLNMMEEHPLCMAPHLIQLMEQVVPLVFSVSAELNVSERVIVTAMNIVKLFHSERSYRPGRVDGR